jgi:hypothetical protein
MERFNSGQSDIFKLEIDSNAKGSFLEMARWTKFLAILGYVMMGIVLALGIFMSIFINSFYEAYGGTSPLAALGSAGPIIVMLFFMLITAIYIYPTYALMKYSACIKTALTTDNRDQFNMAIKYLKNMFKYIGILMIIVLALYGIEMVIGLFAAIGR